MMGCGLNGQNQLSSCLGKIVFYLPNVTDNMHIQ
jgi:hypothetical protein